MEQQIIQPSSLETIDYAFFNFIDKEMNIFCETNSGNRKVPVLWGTAERAVLSRDENIRDKEGMLVYPLISIEKGSTNKDLTKKGAFYGPGNHKNKSDKNGQSRILVSKKIVQEKTKNFANNDSRKRLNETVGNGQPYFPRKNDKVVYESIYIPEPIYTTVTYIVSIKTEYRMQLNQIVQPFYGLGGHIKSFNIYHDGHKYETFMHDFSEETNAYNLNEEERSFETKIEFEVLGYIIGSGENGELPYIEKVQNYVEIKFPRETVMFGDINSFGNKTPYRER